jgi:hypothetical protein
MNSSKSESPASCTLEELDVILNAPCVDERAPWLVELCESGVMSGLDDDDLCDIASEMDERGPVQAIGDLISALQVRHADDRVTLVALIAIRDYHLPQALINHRV